MSAHRALKEAPWGKDFNLVGGLEGKDGHPGSYAGTQAAVEIPELTSEQRASNPCFAAGLKPLLCSGPRTPECENLREEGHPRALKLPGDSRSRETQRVMKLPGDPEDPTAVGLKPLLRFRQ